MARRVELLNVNAPRAVVTSLPGLPVSRGVGPGLEAFADGLYKLNNRLEDHLDKQVVNESALKGARAGRDPNFTPRRDNTLAADAFNKAAMSVYLSDLEIKTRDEIDALTEQHRGNPASLKTALEGYRAGIAGSLDKTAPELVQPFNDLFDRNSRPMVRAAATQQRDALVAESQGKFLQYADAAINGAQRIARSVDLDPGAAVDIALERDRFIERMIDNGPAEGFEFAGRQVEPDKTRPGALNAAKMAELLNKFDDSVYTHTVLGRFERAPDKRKFLAEFETAEKANASSPLSIEQVDAVARDMRGMITQEDQALAHENARAAGDLEIAVERGGATAPTYKDIDRAADNNVITEAKRTQLYGIKDAQRKVEEDKALGLQAVQFSMTHGIPLDWKDKKQIEAVDDYYEGMVGQRSAFDPDVMTATANLVKNTAVVPTRVRSMVRSLARSGNVDHAVAAAELVARLNEQSPQALETIPQDERAFSLMVSDSVSAGMDKQLAVETARQRVYQTSADEMEKLKAVYNAKDFEKDNLGALNKQIDKNFDALFTTQPEAPAAMQGEYDSLVRNYFVRTRDADQARELAWRDLMHVWGATDINGGRQLMKYAPEKLYWNGDAGSAEWMRPQLVRDVSKAVSVIPRFPPESLRVVADDRTARVEQPDYAVIHIREDGLPVPVLDEQNRPLRWRPDFNQTPEAEKLRQEQARNVELAREARQRLPTRQKAIERGTLIGMGLGR